MPQPNIIQRANSTQGCTGSAVPTVGFTSMIITTLLWGTQTQGYELNKEFSLCPSPGSFNWVILFCAGISVGTLAL